MSINTAMNTGVSGMTAEGEALGVIGDNVANTNTIGFKQSRALFEDVLGGAMGSRSPGSGVRMSRTQQIFAQGSLLNTGQATDLALSGDGFFVVSGTVDGLTGDFYTRAGQTVLANDGKLVSPAGLSLLGYTVNADGTFGPGTGPVQVSTAALAPKATSTLTVTANLDASATIPTGAWDPQNPTATSNFSTSLNVYDSLGAAHAVNVYFVQTAAGTWDYHALVDGAEVVGGTAGQNSDIASGTLSFTSDGALQSVTPSAGGTVDFNGATPAQVLDLDFGTSIANGGTGLGGTTGFSAPSSISSQGQDGYSSGSFTGIQIDSTGVVNGVYSNGQKVPVSQLVLAKFRSNDGLGRAGHNLWVATRESGDAALGAAGSGGRPAIIAGALEQSNVDIAQQFVDLIAHQRAFQANSKTITTADEMLQEIMNLKR